MKPDTDSKLRDLDSLPKLNGLFQDFVIQTGERFEELGRALEQMRRRIAELEKRAMSQQGRRPERRL